MTQEEEDSGPCGNCTHPERDHQPFYLPELGQIECVSCFKQDSDICEAYVQEGGL